MHFKTETQFQNAMDLLITTAEYLLDDMKREEDEPCLLGSCPTIQLAVDLFRHTKRHTPGEISNYSTIVRLAIRKIGDRTVSGMQLLLSL